MVDPWLLGSLDMLSADFLVYAPAWGGEVGGVILATLLSPPEGGGEVGGVKLVPLLSPPSLDEVLCLCG